VEKSVEKSQIGSLKQRREDGIKKYIREIGWGMLIGFSWLRIGSRSGLL
jgi:hypothetical protein